MNNKPANESFSFLIQDLARLMRVDFYGRAAGLGLTQAQWRTLARLAHKEGCRQIDLAAIMEVAPITLARFIDGLEESGLVERRRHPTDRRAVQLYITAKGWRLVAKMHEIVARTQDRAFEGIAPADRELLMSMLVHIRGNLAVSATQGGIDSQTNTNGC